LTKTNYIKYFKILSEFEFDIISYHGNKEERDRIAFKNESYIIQSFCFNAKDLLKESDNA